MSDPAAARQHAAGIALRIGLVLNPEAMKLAKRVWVWRTHRGLTLQEVSDRSRVSLTTLTKVECGIRDLPTRLLVAVVERAFAMDMSQFWGPLPRVRRVNMRGRPRTTSKLLAGVRAA